MSTTIRPCRSVKGSVSLPGDKSITHRSLILSALASHQTHIRNAGLSQDCRLTMAALRSLGVRMTNKGNGYVLVKGAGKDGLRRPKKTIRVGESGTSMRLLLGVLAAQPFASSLDGKAALRKRPMLRVVKPLTKMGASITGRRQSGNVYAPLYIRPASGLHGIRWNMKIPSAQVKSAILLSGLYAHGNTVIEEPVVSRDHTERMLRLYRAQIRKYGKRITLRPSDLISPRRVFVPSDISSAAFFMVLALLQSRSRVIIKHVGINPSRAGVIVVLRRMGARIRLINRHASYFEPYADLLVEHSALRGVTVQESEVPMVIDEVPILLVAASCARGKSRFVGVGELRVKETDRLHSMVSNLRKMGISIEAKRKANKEVIEVKGGQAFTGAKLKSCGDHRTVMSLIVAALCADSSSTIDNVSCIGKSFPQFLRDLKHLLIY